MFKVDRVLDEKTRIEVTRMRQLIDVLMTDSVNSKAAPCVCGPLGPGCTSLSEETSLVHILSMSHQESVTLGIKTAANTAILTRLRRGLGIGTL